MGDRISELIAALEEEVKFVREKKFRATTLRNGKLVRTLGEYSIYSFTADRILTAEDGAPGELDIDGSRYDCALVTSRGLELELAIEGALGETIPRAELSSNQAQILKVLVAKLAEAKSGKKEIFALSEQVFQGNSNSLSKTSQRPEYRYQPENAPNQSQAAAIANSFSRSLSVIWGPPGTGKTRTIARLVEAHINAGRRVLLVSHANAAVDAALEDIAAQMEDTIYPQGKILRLGVPKDQGMVSRFPLVLPDTVIEHSLQALVTNKANLEAEYATADALQHQCAAVGLLSDQIKNLERQIQRPEELNRLTKSYDDVIREINDLNAQLAACDDSSHDRGATDQTARLSKARDLRIRISSRQRVSAELSNQLGKMKTAEEQQSELDECYQKFDEILVLTGLDPLTASDQQNQLRLRLDSLSTTLREIEDKIASRRQSLLSDARVVATTLSGVFFRRDIANENFDVLIVDEASMVPMPHLYWAISKATKAVTLVGDFKQLAPIVSADTPIAQKWLGRSIFDQLGIKSVEAAVKNPLVSMLDTQYRMAPPIANVSSELFYGGLLRNADSTSSLGFHDSVFGNERVVIVDTSEIDPWCTTPPKGGRINLYSAGLSIALCRRLLTEHPQISAGIATPYRAQAELVGKGMDDAGLSGRALVNTVHRFQGSEAAAIIFDCVDGKGSKRSMLDDGSRETAVSIGDRTSSVEMLLNVAMTRARGLYVFVVNVAYFEETQKQSLLCRYIKRLRAAGAVVQSQLVDDSYIADPLEKTIHFQSRSQGELVDPGAVFTERNFWTAFSADLANTKQSVVMVSPFLTVKRTDWFIPQFEALIHNGVELKIFTRPIDEHKQDYMREDAATVITLLRQIGANVVAVPKIHQKVAILDSYICWEGSLNILSQRDSREHMRRLEGALLAAEVRRNLRLE